jgi:lysyl-tRNA synthetase, class II
MSEPLEQLRQERLKKLEILINKGIDPYPSRFDPLRETIAHVRDHGLGKAAVAAGRIRAHRGHGKVSFIDLEDQSGRIQLVFKEEDLPEEYQLLELLDLGDILGVRGETFETESGEFSVRVTSFQILSKSLLPLPSTWHGFKDVDERFRKRYVDLLMNPDVRNVAEKRAQITYALRKFLIEVKGYLEVESPVLQPLYGGTRAKPFKTHHNSLNMDLYLRISNELYLKRLIVGGFEKVFEIGHTFRNEGMDSQHNPEFTMLETMWAYADYNDNMELFEEMFEYIAMEVFGTTELPFGDHLINYQRPWKRIRLADLFLEYTGVEFNDINTLEKATELAGNLNVHIEDYMTDGEILLEIFEKKCATEIIQPTFVYDYPADFYPLAKKTSSDPRFVESFDVIVAGMEMGTNYSEQNDSQEVYAAWLKEKDKSAAGNPEAQVMDRDFIESLEYGMPPTTGLGPGIDRWVMVMTNSQSIRDVILFPTLKPKY